MAICFFNNNLSEKYRCTYQIDEEKICVNIEYEIENEIPCINGVRFIGSYDYATRDILIVDSDEKLCYLMKSAFYVGNSSRYAELDSAFITSFQSSIYFSNTRYDKLIAIPDNPRCSSLRIFSNSFIGMMGMNSYKRHSSVNEEVITLSRVKEDVDFDIITDKIKSIKFNDNWELTPDLENGKISINIMPYIEIQFMKRQKCEDMHKFVFEFEVYMQLYISGGFKVDKLWVRVDKELYGFNCNVRRFDYQKRKNPVVEDKLPDFLRKCYANIDYTCTKKIWLRNISYAVGDKSRNLEDNFLLFYKFIECFYKARNIKGVTKSFISMSIKEHYKHKQYSEEEQEKLSREIVCLRNHYVHSGYYIKNKSLKISKPKGEGQCSFEPYTAKVDFKWIYSKTDMLNVITIDIIYRDILGYDNYKK